MNYGDKDGDGFVEYQLLNDQGLINQGGKDSWDGINFADGTLAEPPIALIEVQAYVYVAYLSRAWLAYDAGDTAEICPCHGVPALKLGKRRVGVFKERQGKPS